MTIVNDLLTELQAAALPVVSVRQPTAGQFEADYDGTETAQDITDTEAIIATYESSYATLVAEQQAIDDAIVGLRDKIALAHDPNNAPSITILFNTVLDQTLNRVAQPTRYNNIRAVMDAAPASFQNRFNDDLLAEVGIDATATPLSAAQQRQYCLFARVWMTPLGMLLKS